MLIKIPSPLRSYTNNKSEVEASGQSVDELLDNLDRLYPGIRFRMIDEQGAIRQHIKIYVDRSQIENLSVKLKGSEVIHLICALSGG